MGEGSESDPAGPGCKFWGASGGAGFNSGVAWHGPWIARASMPLAGAKRRGPAGAGLAPRDTMGSAGPPGSSCPRPAGLDRGCSLSPLGACAWRSPFPEGRGRGGLGEVSPYADRFECRTNVRGLEVKRWTRCI